MAHVRVDPVVKQFQRGLIRELSAKTERVSVPTVDLAAHVLVDGVSAGDLIGAEIQQYFPGYGTFSGRVVDIHEDVENPGGILFETVYSDGDGEIIPYDVLQPLLVGSVTAAAAYASMEFGPPEGVRVRGYRLDEGRMPAYVSKVMTGDALVKTEKIVQFLTCVSNRAWDASQVSPGEQYSWSEIWQMHPKDCAEHVAVMQAEVDKLLDAGHAEWADLPEGEVAIPCVGVFRLKQHDLHAGGTRLKGSICVN